jgi:hypothetical protein
MYNKKQDQLLKKFADLSDYLLEKGVITTDSFTGEIGEYIACKAFNLTKSARVNRAVDGVSNDGKKYQVKSKVVNNGFNYNIQGLESSLFDYLVIVYFDELYNVLKIIRISSIQIKNNEIKISASNLKSFEETNISKLKIPSDVKKAIEDFALVYLELQKNNIIRSRRIVGDIGEYYASKRLDLILSDNKNEKGIDAIHKNGLTFEIKTRRVYTSDRRISETRRLNNLVGKSADYLIIVILDRHFKCSGMWLIPMANIHNAKSANLSIVNNTVGTLNLIESYIPWLNSGQKFISFNQLKKQPKIKFTSETVGSTYLLESKKFQEKLDEEYKKNKKGCLTVGLLFAILLILAFIFGNYFS